ncbi:ankyrin repeat domain-containing protein 31-like [Mobula hypostoma]|uniref:ankyrin repeat domain-containing protein 31-like n=1 Tax=Mobula hypostoma TaxID=723540 RepID=UPI002FC3D94B
MNSQNPDTVPSVKRKTGSTHQVKNNVQPNKTNRRPGTSCNMNENKTKQHDVEQSLGRPVTRYMVNLQNQFATYSGQKITQSNNLEIQIKSTSVSVNAVETKLTSYNDNVATGSTSGAQTSLRRSARIRNSTGFEVQAEENSTTSKQHSIENSSKQSSRENSQQHPLVLKPCGAVNKNKSIADLKCHENITTRTGSQLTSPEVELTDTLCTINMLKGVRNKSNTTDAGGKLLTKELLSACNTDEQPAQLIKYSKVHVSEEMLSKVTPCNLNVEMSQKTEYERAGGHCIHESISNNTTSLKNRNSHLPDQDDSTKINKFIEYIPSTESIATAELTIMDDTLPKVEIKQHNHTKNKTLEYNPDSNVILSDVSEFRCNIPMIYEHESGQDLLEPVTSEHISLQQKVSSTTSDYERVDHFITEHKTCNNVTSTPDHSETVILELISQEEHSRDLMTTNDQYNNKPSTCDMVSDCKLNAATTMLHLEYQTYESNANLSELCTSNLNDAKHLARATNMATAEEVNANEGEETINDTFAKYQFGEPAQETNKSGPEHVIAETGSSDDKRNNALHNSDGTSNVHTPEVSTHAKSKNKGRKRSCKLCTTESSGASVRGIVIPKSCLTTPKLHALNKRNGKGETRLHHAVIKRDISSVRSLIAAGIDVNMKDNAGWTALHEASCRGLTNIIQELLKAGADVNCGGMDGLSPLQDAVSSSHYEAVKVLLQNGADPMQKSENGKNAFDEIVDDKIKHLLETYHNSEVTNCEEPQPVTGPPHDECASCDVEQTAPTLQTSKDLESPEFNISEHESIAIMLNEIETKQEKITKYKLKEPENAAQFELELTQIRIVLNEILTKHKAEKEDLVKKFRVSPGSFRQGTLQKQVTALASRQRRFLNLLQKQKTLDQKLQEYKLKQQQLQQNNSVILNNSSTCTTESRIRTDTLCKEVQLSNQCKGFSATCTTEGTGQISITCPQNSECTQEHNFLSQGEIDISANQETNRTSAIEENGMECSIGSVATINLDITSRNNNVSTVSSSIPDSSHRESSSLELHSLETSYLQAETLNSSQADDVDSTPFCSSSQNIPLKASQSINNPENNLESNCGNVLPNTEKSIDTSTVQVTCNTQNCLFVLPASQPTEKLMPMNSMQSQTIGQLKILKSNNQFNIMPNSSQYGRNQQQISQLNTGESGVKDQNIKKINAVQRDYQYTSELNACNNEDSSLVNASSFSGKQHNSKFLPVDGGTGQRRLLNLIDLIKQGLIQPGEDTLDLKLQGVCHKAELQASGMIRGKDGTIYRSPVHWIKELLGDKIPVSRKFAWNKVMYKGKELLKYSSMITTSTTPEIQSISEPIILTDKTSSLTKQQKMCTVECILTGCITARFGNTKAQERNRLKKMVDTA